METKQTARCRNCKHRIKHEFTNQFYYCNCQYSVMTHNGKLKIKLNDLACPLYEAIEQIENKVKVVLPK